MEQRRQGLSLRLFHFLTIAGCFWMTKYSCCDILNVSFLWGAYRNEEVSRSNHGAGHDAVPVCAAAKAVGVEDYSPMPAERCKLILPEGCVLDEVRKDGYLEISLNRSRMDWSTALATGYNFSNRQMHCQIEITPPDNEHTWRYGSWSGNMRISELIPAG